jgi:hypothetical protein
MTDPTPTLKDYQQADFDTFRLRYLRGDTACVCEWQPGLGKAQPLTSKVLTPSGWRLMGDLRIGDAVIGRDGNPHRVTGIFPQGLKACYKVVMSDGAAAECCDEHLWQVENANGFKTAKPRVHSLRKLMDAGLYRRGGSGPTKNVAKWSVPIAAPINMGGPELPIPAYALGLLIGDGSFGAISPRLSCPPHKASAVADALSQLTRAFPSLRPRYYTPPGAGCPSWALPAGKPGHKTGNPVREILDRMGLCVSSPRRGLPDACFTAPVEDRWALLRGLMDADGSCHKNRTTFHTCSARLADNVAALVRSLGGWAKVRPYDRGDKGIEYQVNVRTSELPFRHYHKRDEWAPANFKRTIVSVSYVGHRFMQCISVSAPDHLYVTDDYIVTHNTLLSILLARHFDASRVLVVGPSISLTSWELELRKWWPSASCLLIASGKDIRKLRAHHRVVVVTHRLAAQNDEVRTRLRYWQRDAFSFGVLDEAQYLRGPNTKTTGGCYGRGEGVFATTDKILLLSGTLVVSWPDDLWTHLARWMPERIMLDGQRMDYETFRDRFLMTRQVPIPGAFIKRTQIYGHKDWALPELRERLRDFSIVRDKSEAGLPPLTWRPMELELSAADRKQVEAELMDHLPPRLQVVARRVAAAPQDEDAALRFAEQLAEYEELWGVAMRVLGVGKAKALTRALKEKLQNTPRAQGIGIFSINRKVMDVIDAELREFGVVRIDGSTPPGPKRAQIVEAFQNPTGPRVFNGQIDACGTALTLTRGDTCYFAQLSPIPGANEQAASRFHRIGQQNPVDAWMPYVKGTLDQPLMAILRKKMKTQAAVRGDT